MTRSVEIARQSSETLRGLPGYRLRKFAELWLDPVSLARVVDAPIADLHAEWRELTLAGRRWRGRWAVARGSAALWMGLAAFASRSLIASAPRPVAFAMGGAVCTFALFALLSNAIRSEERSRRVIACGPPVDWQRSKIIEPEPLRVPTARPVPPKLTPVPVPGIVLVGPPWGPPTSKGDLPGAAIGEFIPVPPSGRVPIPPAAESDPVPIVRIPPPYPETAVVREIEGFVVVRLWIGASGDVSRAEVTRAQPRGVFDRSALGAVRRWKYRPGQIDGEAVERGPYEVMLNFSLDDATR